MAHTNPERDALAALVDMLTDPSRAADRAQSFANEGDEVEATCAMLGTVLSDRLDTVNERLREFEAKAGRADPLARLDAIDDAREVFDKLGSMREVLAIDAMRPVLMRAGSLSDKESDIVIGQLDETREWALSQVETLKADNVGQGAFKALRESPAMRRAVGNNEAALSGAGFFAPLLRCFDERIGRSKRAELAARMELYIESGHARQDCFGEAQPDETPSAKAMRELFAQAEPAAAPPKPSLERSSHARRVVEARFSELFQLVQVERDQSHARDDDFRVAFVGASGAPLSPSASGLIDVVIRDARDPTLLHCAAVTAGKDTSIEGSQVLRHGRALNRAITEGLFEAAPHLQGIKSAKLSFYALSTLYSEHDESMGARAALGDGLTTRTKDRLTPAERETVNAIPYVALLSEVGSGSRHLRPGILADVDLRIFGARSERWNAEMQAARQAPTGPDRDAAVVGAAARLVGDAIDLLSKLESAPGELKTTNDHLKTFLEAFNNAAASVTRHGAATPSLLEPIQTRTGAMRALRSKLHAESPVRADLADVIAIYNRPGGVAAWSAALAEDEAAADAALFVGQAERMADLSTTKAFAWEVAGKIDEPDVYDMFAADARADGMSPLGFPRDQAKSLSAELLERAEEKRLNAELIAAAGDGDMARAKSAIKRGADPEAVDAIGRNASEVALAAGKHESAKGLSDLIFDVVAKRARASSRSRMEPTLLG